MGWRNNWRVKDKTILYWALVSYWTIVKLSLKNPSKGKIYDFKKKNSAVPMKKRVKMTTRNDRGKATRKITAINITFENIM